MKIKALLNYKISFIIIGSLIGYISWSFEDIKLTIFSVLIFYLYIHINKRLDFMIIVFSYLLVSSRGLLVGTINYYDQVLYGFTIWFAAAALILFPYSLIWSKEKTKRYYLLPLLIVVLILPPFGFISWVNPIISAGLIFPGLGYFGILLFLAAFYCSLFLKKSSRIIFLSLLSLFVITNSNTPIKPKDIKALNSEYEYNADTRNFKNEYFRQIDTLKKANSSQSKIFVASENILGYYTQNSNMIWDQLEKEKVLYAGAYVKDKDNPKMFDNVIMEITPKEKKVLYKQRVPVLVSMWQPWSNFGAKAHLFKNAAVKTQNKTVAFFICYEQLIDFTFLHSAAVKPDLFIGVSNLWWSKNTTIETIQHNRLKLYSILFNKPLIYSINR